MAGDFADAWARGDMRGMHDLMSDETGARFPVARLRRAYRRAAATATMTDLEAGDPETLDDGDVTVPVVVQTRVFGSLRGNLRIPVSGEHVDWSPRLVFPELRDGERLRRVSVPAMRATLRSQDGKVLAAGPADARTSPLVGIADSIAGRMEPQEAREERAALYARGFPADWPVGQSGLEEAFEQQLRGRPGGELVAGNRVAGASKAAACQGDPYDHPHRPSGGRRGGARGPARRRGRARPAQRRDPGARRHRLLGPAAARLDLQDRDHRGRARAAAW